MKNIFFLTFLFFCFISFGQNSRMVFGVISDGEEPIKQATILNVSTSTFAKSDENGRYQIAVNTGDELEFSYTALRTMTLKIEDVTRVLNIIMIPEITELNEVEVTARKRITQKQLAIDYKFNDKIIKTTWGYMDTETFTGQVWTMRAENFNNTSNCILDLLRGRAPGVRVYGNCSNGGSVVATRSTSTTASRRFIFDVDGAIFRDAPVWINLQAVKRVAVLVGAASTTRYGFVGRAGVVVINTIPEYSKSTNHKDYISLNSNFLQERPLNISKTASSNPNYLKELKSSSSFENAKAVYEKYQDNYSSSPYFFLDAYSYFVNKWDSQSYAYSIVSENYELFKSNPVLLKGLAYKFQENGNFEQAHNVFKDIFLLRPNYGQSYMDMANSFQDLKQPKFAAAIYARYDNLYRDGFIKTDTTVFKSIMEREFYNLLVTNKQSIFSKSQLNALKVTNNGYKGRRLVFEWNDSEAEFNVQFVNQDNLFYTWKHSLADNPEKIKAEKEYGYSVAEFLLDDSSLDTWAVNVNYFGNKSLTPTYLKTTIYYNYGTKNQRKEVKLFKLTLKNVNQELFKIASGQSLITSN
jgi:hypothetical protein